LRLPIFFTKVFASLFSKSDWGSGQRPVYRRSFWYFFLRLHSQEKVRNELGDVTLRKFSPFFLSKELQKEPKTASCGALPHTPVAF